MADTIKKISQDGGTTTSFISGLTGGTLTWKRIGQVVVVTLVAGSASGEFTNTVVASGLPRNAVSGEYFFAQRWGDANTQFQISVDSLGNVVMNISGAMANSIYISYVYLTDDY